MVVTIKNPILIHSQLVGMGKNNKKLQNKIIIIRGLIIAPAQQTAGTTLSKHNTRLTHTAHCAGSSASTTQDLHTQHIALAVVQAQHRTYTHSTLRWQ